MMKHFLQRTLHGACAAIACALALAAPSAQAAQRAYDFSGTLDSGSYVGESFNGLVVFDDAALTAIGNEWLGVGSISNVSITFHGQTYGLGDASVAPEVAFLDGTFLGLAYTAEAGFPKFTTVAGTADSADAFLAYEPAAGLSGAGTIVYTMAAVPDAPGLLLLTAGVGVLAWRSRRQMRNTLTASTS